MKIRTIPRKLPAKPTPDFVVGLLAKYGDEITRVRARQILIEAILSRWPGLPELLRRLPRNLKARWPDLVPFQPGCWVRGDRVEKAVCAAAVEYLRRHPRCTVRQAAARFHLRPSEILSSPQYRDLRLEEAPDALVWLRRPRRRKRPSARREKAARDPSRASPLSHMGEARGSAVAFSPAREKAERRAAPPG